jgi:uncharacterized protein (DUF2236 family)
MSAGTQSTTSAADEEIAGYFGPESITWRIGREAVLLLGGGRATLMQLAHPLVAAGVGQHSSYSRAPWARVAQTLHLTQTITFGTRTKARQAARTINRLHIGVTGTLTDAAGDIPTGASYRARDPDLLLWVLATLVDTVLGLYPLLVEPLSRAEQEQYYQESKKFGVLLGLPTALMPTTLADFEVYMYLMLTGNTLAITPEARDVARMVMHMPAPPMLRPFLAVTEQVTVGILPPRLREMYGLSWDWRREVLLQTWAASTRRIIRRLPPALREMPMARAAWRRVGVSGQLSA